MHQAARRTLEAWQPEERGTGDLVGSSPSVRRLLAQLEVVAASDSTVVLLGEAGTGKDTVAETIHALSRRRDRPFVVLDCGAPPEARSDVLEPANGGTLFVDEITELPLPLQAKLLRALEMRSFRSVGDSAPRRLDIRVIAATSRDLACEVARGTLREDLYLHLSVVKLDLPPLRERREDIPLLARRYLREVGAEGIELPDVLREAFTSYAWPGNLPELRNAVERAVVHARLGDPDSFEMLESGPQSDEVEEGEGAPPPITCEIDASMPYKEMKRRAVDICTRAYLEKLVRETGGRVGDIARRADIDRGFTGRLLRRYGLR
jgi:transcriptional regulator with GAF, ATPase, and Fis domain